MITFSRLGRVQYAFRAGDELRCRLPLRGQVFYNKIA